MKPNKLNKGTHSGGGGSGNILIFLRGTDFIAHGKLDAKMLHTSLQCDKPWKMKNTKLYINQRKIILKCITFYIRIKILRLSIQKLFPSSYVDI